MNIKLDIITLLEEQGAEINESQLALLQELKNWVEPKLSPFKKSLKREERKQECYIMIHILAPEDQWLLPIEKQNNQIRLTLNGYSPDLTNTIYKALGDNKWAAHIRELKLAETSLN